jgi:ubiquinone/menaquinone biosynthesis C-methylase UbiE
MQIPDYVSSYRAHLAQLVAAHGRDRAMELVVGGAYAEMGALEANALIHLGLQPGHTLVDVGCGTGRLALHLRDYLMGKYIGTDLLDEALAFARSTCGRPDWEFVSNHLPTIPAPDASADFVSFFSVFTHLLDEDIFKFLREARRVLKPAGKIVFSFLDFECYPHWEVFLRTVEDPNPNRVLNKFLAQETVRRWACRLALKTDAIRSGTDKWIPLPRPVTCENGKILEGLASFGQSIAVLSIFPEAAYLARYPDVVPAIAAGIFKSGAHHYDICGYREGREV